MTKITKKDYFKMLAGVVENSEVENKQELQEFIQKEITLLENKSSVLTPKQKENADLKEYIYNKLFELNKPVTISELQAEDVKLAELQNQRVSALVKQLKDEGKVVRTELKKKAYFTIAN